MGTQQAVFQEGVAKRDSKVTQPLRLSELTSHLMHTQEFWCPQIEDGNQQTQGQGQGGVWNTFSQTIRSIFSP